jgi:YidC/Oxa1 family membrane protein insertase
MHGMLPTDDLIGTSDPSFAKIISMTSLLFTNAKVVCPNFGEPGWGPLCFLNGNPVFNAFDTFQEFIQNSIVGLSEFVSSIGIENSYGLSIILFTCLVRAILFPLAYQQISSTQATTALTPKITEIKEKYPDDKDLQNQLVAMMYDEAQTNPLAGCLPSLVQIPVFIALYRSFLNLASTNQMAQSFLWLPNLEGPTFGVRSSDWILKGWEVGVPSLGWHDTFAYLTLPILLVIAQTVSLQILTPPSDDPKIQQTQKIFKYLPLLLGYFSLSVPSALGLYWITNNILSTVTTGSIKEYFKKNPLSIANIDIEMLATKLTSTYFNAYWGYTSRQQVAKEAQENFKSHRQGKIPSKFI